MPGVVAVRSSSTEFERALGVAGAASAIRRGEITAESYATQLLSLAKALADLKSFITIDEGAVLEAARAADLRGPGDGTCRCSACHSASRTAT